MCCRVVKSTNKFSNQQRENGRIKITQLVLKEARISKDIDNFIDKNDLVEIFNSNEYIDEVVKKWNSSKQNLIIKNFDLKLEANKKNHKPTNFLHALQITGYVCITEAKNAKRTLRNRRSIAKKENI